MRAAFRLFGSLLVAVALAGCAPATAPRASAPQAAPPLTLAATRAAAAAYDGDDALFHPVRARQGMAVSAQALATGVGRDILQAGGNAVDAAVGMGFALAVVLPNAGNLGGGGFMVLHLGAEGRDVALDFREQAPAAATATLFQDAAGQVVPGRSLFTPLAVGVPGTVAGLVHAQQRWGTWPLARVMAPAIALAERGFPVSRSLAEALQRNRKPMAAWPATRAIFWHAGEPLREGATLVQHDLAQSLRAIARDGAAAFYHGPIARRIAASMARHGGLITRADLANYTVRERAPVVGEYRGLRVVTMPPPSSGGVLLVQLLNMAEHWPLAQWGAGSARTIHHLSEAMKLAYADRAVYLGDPDFVPVPVAGLTDKAYASRLVARIDADRARPAADIAPGQPQLPEGGQTTHYSVLDQAGNAVAVTVTLNTYFGTGMVAEGTGILLNNEMDDFSAKPGVANVYGLVGGHANAIAPHKRPLSSMTPTIVLRDGAPWLVTGSPGGARIITTVLEAVIDAVDFGMNPAEAVAQPRFHDQLWPDVLRVERGLSPDTRAILERQGHRVVVQPAMGSVQTIQAQDGWMYGASDPRSPDGLAAGY